MSSVDVLTGVDPVLGSSLADADAAVITAELERHGATRDRIPRQLNPALPPRNNQQEHACPPHLAS